MADQLGVLICGYGANPEANKAYLCFILHELIKLSEQNKKLIVIASGGETNRRSHPGKTEADMIADYLNEKLGYHGVKNFSIFPERTAYTTRQNLEYAVLRFKIEFQTRYLPKSLVIVCKRSHVLGVKLLSKFLWGFIPEIIAFEERIDGRENLKQKLGAFLSLAGLWISPIARLELKRKQIE